MFIIARKPPKPIIKAYNWAHKHKVPILAYLTNPFLHDETVSDNFRMRLHEQQSIGIFDDAEDLEYQMEVDLRISLGVQDIDAIQPQRTFVWRSSVCSVTAGCVSAIAIAETVLSCVLVVLCSLRFATFSHVLIGCAIVPVFLFRTSANTEETVRLLSAMLRHLHVAVLRPTFTSVWRLLLVASVSLIVASIVIVLLSLLGVPKWLAGFMALPLALMIVWGPTHTASSFATLLLFPLRVRSIITSLFHDFTQTVLAAKANFYRVGFCLDLFHPPELVPGLERYLQKTGFQRKAPSIADADYCYPSDWRFHRSLNRFIVRAHAPAPRGPAGYPTFIGIETFLIRATVRTLLKGTLLIYAPFIWFLADGSLDDLDLDSRMHLICESSIAKVSRAYSTIVMIASVFVIGIAPHRDSLFAGVQLPKVAALSAPELFFTPSFGLTTWRAFVCVGGVLGWLTYLVADMAVRRAAVGRPWPAPRLQTFFFICRICRGVIATFVVIGMLYFVLRLQYE